MRDFRAANPEMSPEQAAKERARVIARAALANGRLTAEPCKTCGDHAEMHHEDYGKPLDVQWLCHPCHLFEHGEIALPRWLQIRFEGHLRTGPLAELFERITGPMPAWWEETAAKRQERPRMLPTLAGEREAG